MKRKVLSFVICLAMLVTTFMAVPSVVKAEDAASNTATITKGTTVYAEADESADTYQTLFEYTITLEEKITKNGTEWYKYSCNSSLANIFKSKYPYIKASDVSLDNEDMDIPETVIATEKVGDIEVSVAGNIPKDVTLSLGVISNEDFNFESFGIEDTDTLIAALDIKLYEADGTEWQPDEPVTVSIDAEALGMSEGLAYGVLHDHEGELINLGQYQVSDGKVTFATGGFSVFAVTGLWGVSAGLEGQTVVMEVGDTLYFKCNTAHNNWNHNWTVDSNGYVTIATYTYPDGSDNGRQNSYVGVTANNAGTVTLSCRDNSVTIQIVEKTASNDVLTINDEITTNGCLVPEYSGDQVVESYKWYKNVALNESGDYTEVTGEAVSTTYAASNGVNIAVDQGGKCWYKVEALDADGGILATSEPYWVPYSNVIENGSFETPNITGYNPFDRWGAGNVQFNQEDTRYVTTAENVSNGTALWWRTTGAGASNNAPGRDIEIIRPGNAVLNGAYYVNPADGNQYAELNCEAVGTLYQDVLTAPNTTLKWSFSHLGREGTDTMAVVVMPAASADKYAERLANATSAEAINRILEEIDGLEGAEVWNNLTASAEGDEYIPDWTHHEDEYQTVDNQYLSRFFFVSVQSSSGSNTKGNLIDGVNFDDRMNYTIRYFVDGALQDTETGKVKPYTTVTASKTDDYSDYALKEVVKAANGTEDRSWGTTSMKVDTNDVYLDLHYVTTGVSITKKVELTGTDGMTDQEIAAAKEEILGSYDNNNATFELKLDNETVANASVTVNAETGEGVALFMNGENIFRPELNKSYTIVETSDHKVDGYTWTYSNVIVETGESYAVSAIYTNRYEPGLTEMTITKTVDQLKDTDQTFVFTIKGTDEVNKNVEMTVVIKGGGTVTIKDIPIGNYTVTEDTGWSWRYTPDGGSKKTTIVYPTGGAVTFANKVNSNNWLDGSAYAENIFTTIAK